jgi:virginiamycin B lyase
MKNRVAASIALSALFLCWANIGWAQSVTEFPAKTASSTPRGLTDGPGQTVWYGTHSTRKIGRIDLTQLSDCQTVPSCITEYQIPNTAPGTDPYNLVMAPDGTIWFTEGFGGKVGRLDPTKLTGCASTPTVCITEYTPPTAGTPIAITVGPDGNIWFNGSKTVRVDLTKLTGCETVATHCMTEFPIVAGSLAAGSDGNLWGTLHQPFAMPPAAIERIDMSKLPGCDSDSTKCLTLFPITAAGSNPDVAASGPDGNIWFTDFSGTKMGKVDLSALAGCVSGSCITETSLPAPFAGSLGDLTAGPDGGIWFLDGGNHVGRLATSGQVTASISIPTAGAGAARIRKGPDGNLWITEGAADKIGRVNLTGGGGNPTPTPTPTPGTPTRTPTGTSSGAPRGHVTPLNYPTPRGAVAGRQ